MSEIFELGLYDLDRVANTLGGGIPKGSLVLLEGDTGSGKSVWSQRFTYGICEEGYKVTYISAEENAKSFVNQMNSLSYDISSHLLYQNLLFLRADTSIASKSVMEEDNKENMENYDAKGYLIDNLIHSEIPWRSDVIVIDNFEELLLNDTKFMELFKTGGADNAMQMVRTFFEKMMQEGKTIIVSVNSENIPSEAIRPIQSFSTVHLRLNQKMVGGSTRRNASVLQYKNMPGSVDDSIGFGIRSGQGLSIENRTIA